LGGFSQQGLVPGFPAPPGLHQKTPNVYAGPPGFTGFYPQVGGASTLRSSRLCAIALKSFGHHPSSALAHSALLTAHLTGLRVTLRVALKRTQCSCGSLRVYGFLPPSGGGQPNLQLSTFNLTHLSAPTRTYPRLSAPIRGYPHLLALLSSIKHLRACQPLRFLCLLGASHPPSHPTKSE